MNGFELKKIIKSRSAIKITNDNSITIYKFKTKQNRNKYSNKTYHLKKKKGFTENLLNVEETINLNESNLTT